MPVITERGNGPGALKSTLCKQSPIMTGIPINLPK